MLVAGLTGSIGAGKSTVAARFRANGIPALDADAVVHGLYRGAAVPPIAAAFSGVVTDGAVDRERLSRALIADPSRFAVLEAIVHPLVRDEERKFLADAKERGEWLAVLEIPLLFETGADKTVDVTIVATANREVQRQRVLARPGMTPEKFDGFLRRQTPDAEKIRRAAFVVDTNATLEDTNRRVDDIVATLRGRIGTAYERCWRGR